MRPWYIFSFICMLAAATVTAGDCRPASTLTPVPPARAAVQPMKLAAVSATAHMTASASQANPSANTTDGKDVCLGCHGPFDKLATAPKTYTSESGAKINPHQYVPHDRTDEKSVVDCMNCHKPHPVPLASKEGLPKPNVDWCYSCHHTNEISSCGTCHQ